MNRKQRRAAKNRKHLSQTSKELSKTIDDSLSRLPTRCDECEQPFDRLDKTMINEWKIAVYDDGPIHLVCPECVPADIAKQSSRK
jgi:hypothetical protein